MDRPEIGYHHSSESFLQHYYLKDEMIAFLRENNLPASGCKDVLKRRIARFIDGMAPETVPAARSRRRRTTAISDDSLLGHDFVCSEAARAFFKDRLGRSFTFKVAFQRWLRDNPGATYAEACEAYRTLIIDARGRKSEIGPQFEYNAYIRDFFAANPGRSLEDAIRCWNHRKRQPGPHRYS
ncbi:MAG: SAP domain-containing protein, partial [Muribaculaceae bacterium]|nr:SAP domain-containing protein [Muribaculaceae bacterium]